MTEKRNSGTDHPGAAEDGSAAEAGRQAPEPAGADSASGAEAPPTPATEGGAAPDEGDGAAEQREPTMEERLAALESEKGAIYDRLLRTTADFDNFRKRTRRDLTDARADGKGQVLREVLPAVDNLERALAHAEASGGGGDAGGIAEGVKLVLRQLAQALERCDVKPVPAQGQPFDPTLHEAVSQLESTEVPPGHVAQVFQQGYKVGDRLLRPALVAVARAPAAASGDGAERDDRANGHDSASEDGQEV